MTSLRRFSLKRRTLSREHSLLDLPLLQQQPMPASSWSKKAGCSRALQTKACFQHSNSLYHPNRLLVTFQASSRTVLLTLSPLLSGIVLQLLPAILIRNPSSLQACIVSWQYSPPLCRSQRLDLAILCEMHLEMQGCVKVSNAKSDHGSIIIAASQSSHEG